MVFVLAELGSHKWAPNGVINVLPGHFDEPFFGGDVFQGLPIVDEARDDGKHAQAKTIDQVERFEAEDVDGFGHPVDAIDVVAGDGGFPFEVCPQPQFFY